MKHTSNVLRVYFHPRDRAAAEERYDFSKYLPCERDDVPPGYFYVMSRPIEENVTARIALSALFGPEGLDETEPPVA